MDEKKNEIILFENQGVKLEVNLKDETVWLNRQQMATLFNRDVKTIGKHINNALAEELADIPTVAKFATVQKEGEREVKREVEYYNLDMILSVGYRVKSDKGILFRKWANNVLKDYMLRGYAVNQKRLEYLEKTVKLIEDSEPAIIIKFTKFEYSKAFSAFGMRVKKYIKQNARLVAFNVDPLFNNAIDGLMYIRIADIPESTMKPVMEEFQAELERKLGEK